MKSLAEELDFLRKAFRDCVNVYAARLDSDLVQVREAVIEQAKNPKPPASRIRDLRDMLTLCRTLDLKPEKGRRKDLKKIDLLIEELSAMVKDW
jgi:hypothetical protein